MSSYPPSGNGILTVASANPNGFATFSVGPGEVVDLGKLIIIEVHAEVGSFLKPSRYVYVSHVSPLPPNRRPELNPDLASRVVSRTMQSSGAAIPQSEFRRICEEKRTLYAAYGGANSAACVLAGRDPKAGG